MFDCLKNMGRLVLAYADSRIKGSWRYLEIIITPSLIEFGVEKLNFNC